MTPVLLLPHDGESSPPLALPVDEHVRQHIHLTAKPFSEYGPWAYIALTVITLVTMTVVLYMLYSCYHSARLELENLNRAANETELKTFPEPRTRRFTFKNFKHRFYSARNDDLHASNRNLIAYSGNQASYRTSTTVDSATASSELAEWDSPLNYPVVAHTVESGLGAQRDFISGHPPSYAQAEAEPIAQRRRLTPDEQTVHLFDSNNIRYASPFGHPTNPMTETMWDHPKLSPVPSRQ